MTGDLGALRERIRGATAPDRDLDIDLYAHLLHPGGGPPPAGWQPSWVQPYTASVDAALALVERKLPGAGYSIIKFDNPAAGVQAELADEPATAPTAPLAILAALLDALIAMGGG